MTLLAVGHNLPIMYLKYDVSLLKTKHQSHSHQNINNIVLTAGGICFLSGMIAGKQFHKECKISVRELHPDTYELVDLIFITILFLFKNIVCIKSVILFTVNHITYIF